MKTLSFMSTKVSSNRQDIRRHARLFFLTRSIDIISIESYHNLVPEEIPVRYKGPDMRYPDSILNPNLFCDYLLAIACYDYFLRSIIRHMFAEYHADFAKIIKALKPKVKNQKGYCITTTNYTYYEHISTM